jgi:hypothetical protein
VTLREIDYDLVRFPLGKIVLLQLAAEPTRLDTNNGVSSGAILIPSAKNFCGNRVLFKLILFLVHGLFDHKSQEGAQTF